jgi:hypothetical protein
MVDGQSSIRYEFLKVEAECGSGIPAYTRHNDGSVELALRDQRRRTGAHAITVSVPRPNAATVPGKARNVVSDRRGEYNFLE